MAFRDSNSMDCRAERFTTYVEGWCLCIKRSTVELCLRLREQGLSSKVVDLPYVKHFGGLTSFTATGARDYQPRNQEWLYKRYKPS